MTGFLLGVFFLSKLKLTNIMLSSRNRLAAGFTDTRLRPRYFRASIGGKATCASYSSLREWLTKDCKAENAEELLVVAEMPEISGLGLKATKAIRKGDEILSVPRSALIDAESARASLGDELADQLPEWALITVHLLAERALGTSSWWHPYLSSLPDQTLHPLCWPEDLRASLLQGSPMLATVHRLRDEARANLELLIHAGAAETLTTKLGLSAAVVSEQILSESAVVWAAATLLSRGRYFTFATDAFSLALAEADAAAEAETEDDEEEVLAEGDFEDAEEADGGDDIFGGLEDMPGDEDPTKALRLALVPFLDLMNHASEAGESAEPRYDPIAQAAVLRAHRDFAAGEEVTTSYGPQRSASELLVDYGFVDARNANYWIEVPLKELARSAKRGNQRLIDTCLAGIGEEEVSVVLDEGGPDATILSWLRTAHASLEDLQRAGWDVGIKLAPRGGFGGGGAGTGAAPAAAAATDVDPSEVTARALMVVSEFEEPAGPLTEVRALESLVGLMDEKLARYTTRLEEDTAFVRARDAGATPSSSGGVSLLPEPYRSDATWQRVEVFVRRALASEKRALEGTRAAGLKWMSMIKRGIPLRKVYRLRGKDRERAQQLASSIVEDEAQRRAEAAQAAAVAAAEDARKGQGKRTRRGANN